MFVLTATLKAKEGMEEELEKLLLAVVPQVAAEPEALEYTLHRALDDPGTFYFYERYASEQAFNQHLVQPYIQALFTAVEPLLAAPSGLRSFTPLAGIDRKD